MCFFEKPEEWPITPIWFETGTGFGDSVALAALLGYPNLFTVDINPERTEAAQRRFAEDSRVMPLLGTSPEILRQILTADMWVTFWLDAHYSGPGEWEAFDPTLGQCPLLAELATIRAVPWKRQPFIAIDDVALFDGTAWRGERLDVFDPAKFGHYFDFADWPNMEQIRAALPEHQIAPDHSRLFCTPI